MLPFLDGSVVTVLLEGKRVAIAPEGYPRLRVVRGIGIEGEAESLSRHQDYAPLTEQVGAIGCPAITRCAKMRESVNERLTVAEWPIPG